FVPPSRDPDPYLATCRHDMGLPRKMALQLYAILLRSGDFYDWAIHGSAGILPDPSGLSPRTFVLSLKPGNLSFILSCSPHPAAQSPNDAHTDQPLALASIRSHSSSAPPLLLRPSPLAQTPHPDRAPPSPSAPSRLPASPD